MVPGSSGTLSPSFSEASGSYLNIRQLGNIVYLAGVVKAESSFGGSLGTFTGVDAPLRITEIPVLSHNGNPETVDDYHQGEIVVVEALGTKQIATNIASGDTVIIINGFYFTA